ncbi:MAG: long-chain fatty acid--CoA ligase [Candidatus Marinimicrobia bacterium]|nr:long-chain fatty acid--CoA ligase [Candidatus Neomarinimicrobiota bacterium]
MDFRSLPDMLRTNANRFKDGIAQRYKSDGEWKDISYGELGQKVRLVAQGLASKGIEKGDKVAILSENRPEWAACDFGIQSAGAIVVPVYPTLIGKQIEYILRNSDSKMLIASNSEQVGKILPLLGNLPELTLVVVMDSSNGNGNGETVSLEGLMEDGKNYAKNNENWYDESVDKVKKMDIMTIIYTSGTTGEPKGVLLTHNNFISNVEGALGVFSVDETDTFLSFLPLSHVFERMAGHNLAYSTGATVAFAESIDKVAANMGEVHPTLMTSVPRLYEKMYAKVHAKVEAGSPLKKKLFNWAFGIGAEMRELPEGESPGIGLKIKHALASKLVFSKLKARVGGKLRFFASGGAPLSAEIGEFFARAGIIIIEGYGLTETSPIICVGLVENPVFGTVGPPIFNVELKIADDGEILTRGPHVMVGYYKDDEATSEIIDSDGWLHTGDIGEMDEGGRLRITDRKKNILVTAGGKNIAPAPIENMLVLSPLIEQVMLIGDRRKFISALIAPELKALKSAAEKAGFSVSSNEELVKDPGVYNLMEDEINRLQADISNYERVKKFVMIPRLLTIEDGEITPSLKIKRKVVIDKFSSEIDALYQE